MKSKTAKRIGAVLAVGSTVAAFVEFGVILHLILEVTLLETVVAVVSVFVLFFCFEMYVFTASRVAEARDKLQNSVP